MLADILLIMVLELRDLKAYGTFIIGWRLNYGTERNDTELFLFFPVCLDLNSRGVASLSGHELAERGWGDRV